MMEVSIGRINGPYTDEEVSSTYDPHEIEIVKDVLAMVNKASSGKEQWYLRVNGGDVVIPEVR